MSGGVPPSSRAGRRGSRLPVNHKLSAHELAEARKGANLYERFSGHDAEITGRVNVRAMPKVGVAIGDIDGILYTTIRDGKTEAYIHEFRAGDQPLFVVSPDGKNLYLIGGRFDFTERGIVDKSDPSR